MNRFCVVILISLLIPSGSWSAESLDNVDDAYPDLLTDSKTDGLYGFDLLADDPHVEEGGQLQGDPIFEDDFSFNRPEFVVWDPLEPVNRVFFEFNDRLYFWVLKPVKKGYSAVLPGDIRLSIGNFFRNIASPVRLINNILQGEIEDAGVVLGRFLINSTLGVFGLGDPAYRDFDIEPRQADFGQTLGKWGVGGGLYFCWPGLGPSNVRDTLGFFGDVYMHPVPYINDDIWQDIAYLTVSRVNTLSLSPEVYEELKRISLDPYVASRQAYHEYRRSIIETR